MYFYGSMVAEYKKYELFGKTLFEKMVIIPPFKKLTLLSDEACFVHIIEGQYISVSEESVLKITAKESLLMKCGNYIAKMPVSANPKKYEMVAIHFLPEILKRIYDNEIPSFLKNRSGNFNTGMVKITNELLLQKYVDGILFYFENPAIVTEELLILKLKELILLLNQTKDAPLVHQILSNLFSPATYSFKEIIEAHIFSGISIAELAELTNQSVSSFKRKFEKIYTESPAAYFKTKRLEKAAELLLISDLSINEIALECGFGSIAHFSKCFQQQYDLAPTKYRLSQKNKSLN
ncbi:exoenzyme S synthesis regulatory protein ExsA [mine drainage metagenome]|uniref:Exoenzyme S synthesis regulatory protein ExsA n=1 Tax=mine drainage metagenome TaxID=410659 RepID=A0A1J5S6S5_9ZZZZ